MKTAASTRVEESVFKRLERLAQADKRTIANVIEICIEGYLPEFEREVLGGNFVGGATPESGKEDAA